MNHLQWQLINSKDAAMLHVLIAIIVLPVCLYFGFVALLVFVTELIK
jgi:hypothetical protein